MTEPTNLPLHDSARSAMWLMLALGGACTLVAAPAIAVFATRPDAFQNSPTGQAIFLTFMVAGFGAVVLLLLGIVIAFNAGRTRVVMARFSRGDVLADWTIDQAAWEPFVARQSAPLEAVSRKLAWLGTFPVMIVGAIIVIAATNMTTRLEAALATALGGSAIWWLFWRLALRSASKRIEMMRRTPRVLIGHDGTYCGGVLTFWNANMTVLRSARVVAGNPSMVEFVTGAGKTAQMVDGASVAVNLVSLVAGEGFATDGSAAKIMTTVQVPIPAGMEGEASRVVIALLPGRVPATAFSSSTSEPAVTL